MAAAFTAAENKLIDECYDKAIELTKKAGELIKEGFAQSSKNYTVKANPWEHVSEYDKKVEDVVIEGLRQLYPNHKFIAEESTENGEFTNDPTWIIDPIDGTTNFLHSNPLVCISVAFAINKEIVIGIIYNPIHNEFYSARIGKGSFLNGKSIRCSQVEELKKSIFSYEITFLILPKEADRMLQLKRIFKFASVAAGTRCLGSAALTLAYVARGAIDGYMIEMLKPWDLAAGVLLIRESGGSVYSLNGTTYDLMDGTILCAGTEALCQVLIDGTKECLNFDITIGKQLEK